MKTKTQIINSRKVYLHDWKDSKESDIFLEFYNNSYDEHEEFRKKEFLATHKDEKILFATYTYENYSGSAWVLFTKKGKLYEVNGGHCSCSGLEGQWESEEVLLKELIHRVTKGTFGVDTYNGGSFDKELKKFLGI